MNPLCQICNLEKEESELIHLRCSHSFCWLCIENYLKETLDSSNKCPMAACNKFLRDWEVRQILSKSDIETYERLCLGKITSKHSCVLPECGDIILCNDENIQFDCKKCSIFNCIKCRTAHKGMLCGQLISKNGKSLQSVCQQEILRARLVLQKRQAAFYRRIIAEMEACVLVSNSSVFLCQICLRCIGKDAGIIIRQCFHDICRSCLREHVKNCQNIPIHCPFENCQIKLEDRECREILLESDKVIYEMKCIMHAARCFHNAEGCRQFNCTYLCEADRVIKDWKCPSCGSVNCVICNAIHDNENCQQYLKSRVPCNDDQEIEQFIKEKICMRCLACGLLIRKTSGCNWIQCPSCHTELCWINQTYRWGPKGRGDISGGCKCGVRGRLCHPDCVGCTPHAQCSIM